MLVCKERTMVIDKPCAPCTTEWTGAGSFNVNCR